MKRVYYIVNAHSGKGTIKTKIGAAAEILQAGGCEVTLHFTEARGDAYNSAKQATHGAYDIICCSGGDGTLNEVVGGVFDSGVRVPIGYMPCGTMNDFARCLGIPRNIEKAAQSVVGGKVISCDIGKLGDRHFTYVACFGAYTDVSYDTPQKTKNILGNAAYLLNGLKNTFPIKNYHIKLEFEGGTIEGEYILGIIGNSTSVAGVRLPGVISVQDGEFEVLLIKTPKSPADLQNVLSKLIAQNVGNEYIQYFKASDVKITSDKPIAWCLDGEFGGDIISVEIHNLHKSVDFIVPIDSEAYRRDYDEELGFYDRLLIDDDTYLD